MKNALLTALLLAFPLFAETTTIRCESRGGKEVFCAADTSKGVKLVQQLSLSPCEKGESWDYDKKGITVRDGCRAEFEVGSGSSGGGTSDEPTIILCESSDGKKNTCKTDTRGGVTLHRKLSKASCTKGTSWDYDSKGIWVNNGCRAEFEVGPPSSAKPTPTPDPIVLCESSDGKKKSCKADTRGGVTLHKKLSRANCTKGTSWDYDSKSIWVSNGCRAEFKLGSSSSSGGTTSLPPYSGGSGSSTGSLPPLDPGPGTTQAKTQIKCESKSNQQKFCSADIGSRKVKLIDRLSDADCKKGRDWDYTAEVVWVSNGCRAVFEIE